MAWFAAVGCWPPPPMGGGTINLGAECTTTRTIEPTWRGRKVERADELHCLAVDHVQHPAGDRDDVPAAGLYQVRLIHPVLGGIGVGIGCRGTSLPGRRRTFGPPR